MSSTTADPRQATSRGAVSETPPFEEVPRTVLLPAVLAIYFLAGKLGLTLALVHASASAVWPPTGIALAAVLLFGYRVWPALLVGAFLVNVTTAGSVATSIGIGVGNTLEAIVGGLVVRRYAGGTRAFRRPQGIFRFVLLAATASTMVSATIGVGSLWLGGSAESSRVAEIWLTWWLGDAVGALVFTPLIVLWARPAGPRLPSRGPLETFAFAATLIGGGWFVFHRLHPLAFLSLPPLVWAAFRFGRRGAVTATAILSGIALSGTLLGAGPFVRSSLNESLLFLQAFVGTVTVLALVLAADTRERESVEATLRRTQGELETTVRRRTASLEEAVRELQESRLELERRMEELARSNAELTIFAHVASHDLREPLRTVASNVQLMERRLGDADDPAIRRSMAYAVEGVRKLDELITDLLEYSRANHPRRVDVDADRALLEAIDQLRSAIDEAGARVERSELPRVTADPAGLVQLFQNLVSNAIKYRDPDRPLHVRIGAVRRGPLWVFEVADNGRGFERSAADRVFVVFERLHPDDGIPGTGIGLAICRRIVESHGGRIWAESEPGRGSVFRFTLPASGAGDPAALSSDLAE